MIDNIIKEMLPHDKNKNLEKMHFHYADDIKEAVNEFHYAVLSITLSQEIRLKLASTVPKEPRDTISLSILTHLAARNGTDLGEEALECVGNIIARCAGDEVFREMKNPGEILRQIQSTASSAAYSSTVMEYMVKMASEHGNADASIISPQFHVSGEYVGSPFFQRLLDVIYNIKALVDDLDGMVGRDHP
jgi:hypothetical protein